MNEESRSKLKQAEEHFPSNQKFLRSLKKSKPRALDAVFHEAHDDVFNGFDCLTCANCCKTTSPIFRDVDIERLARHLRLKPGAFIAEYLHLDDEQHYVLNTAPCPFLGADNRCSVYENRPQACREYPHTDRKNMHQILELTSRNTLICPAVNDIVEKIRKGLPPRGGRKR